MPLRPVTDSEARRVIHASLSAVWVFRHAPSQPAFLREAIVWSDVLEIPPVTRSWLYTQTLVAAYLLDRERLRPRLNRRVFFGHLALAAGVPAAGIPGRRETVEDYRDFLLRELIVRERS